ncbi:MULTISPECIES: hypothetical protein [Stenotrophomonas]|uniref:hypothetical protein n=1 Tax=Stenotrophomonas TaxID=40323 RepID=UPI000872A587|nr:MULTISPECIES: hypothetical protein [Stenotrophomonas]OEZ02295.1 hypothetical protein BIY45_01840 [Stenotrophomonas sp. BIIR7]
MARIRSIKPEFWSSEQVMECSPMARLLFIGLWNFCDDGGNHVASAKTVKAEIFPGDDISSTDVQRMLDELSSNSLIAFYSNAGKDYLHVTGWKKHQKIDRPTFKHPRYSKDDRRALDEPSPPEGKGEEGSGEEGKEHSSLRSESSPQLALTGDPSAPADLKAKRADRIRQIFEDARAAYNDVLAKPNGQLPACTVVNKPRLKAVEKALPTVRQLCQAMFGSEKVTPQFWQAYFETAAGDDFHNGNGPYTAPHENWRPDFEYLLRETVIAKLADRAASEAAA